MNPSPIPVAASPASNSKTRDLAGDSTKSSLYPPIALAPPPVRSQNQNQNQNQHLSEDRLLESLLFTVTTAFLGGRTMQVRQVRTPRGSHGQQIFNYGFRAGNPGASLIFLIPGFGCPFYDKTVAYLGEVLHDRGFHVATLHSPAHPEFLMNSHYSGIGGVTSEDARDVFTGIKAIQAQLKESGLSFNKMSLLGYSMGALNAAFVAHLARDSKTPFHRSVLINPPVCMAHGMSVLDSFVEIFRMPKAEKSRLVVKAGLGIVAPVYLRSILRYSRISQIERFIANRKIWTQKELSALIGYAFESTVAGGIEVASAMGKFGKDHSVTSFTDYCSLATVPLYQRNFPNATTEDLFLNESLLKIGPSLARDGNVHVLHNEDDFLLRPTEIIWLKSQFGSSLKLFETGGHLGNVWRPEFHASLEDSLGV